MISFVSEVPQGRVLVLGLFERQLQQLKNKESIPVPLSGDPGSGRLSLLCGNAHLIAQAKAQSPDALVAGITPRSIQAIQAGEPVSLSLPAIGVPQLQALALFTGKDEDEIRARMRWAGLLKSPAPRTPSARTPIAGLATHHPEDAKSAMDDRRKSILKIALGTPVAVLLLALAFAVLVRLIVRG